MKSKLFCEIQDTYIRRKSISIFGNMIFMYEYTVNISINILIIKPE